MFLSFIILQDYYILEKSKDIFIDSYSLRLLQFP